MRRKIILGLLLMGTVLGFGAGVARLIWHSHHPGAFRGYGRMHHRRAAFERHVADVCVDAALRARANAGSAENAAPAQ